MVIALIVYADVLIFLNTLVDYFLLLATRRITGGKTTTLRQVFAAVIGGFSSVYIFLPTMGTAGDFLLKILTALCLSAVCFKFEGLKYFLKNTIVLFLVTCAYAGVMFAVWLIFKPYGMVINNSVVYFHISPAVLVISTAGGYIAFTLLWKIFKKSSMFARRCAITVFAEGKSVTLDAIADTGNSLEDVFGKSEVIIADKSRLKNLFGECNPEQDPRLGRRYRVLPCNTVSGFDTLEGFRCDSAWVEYDGKKTVLDKPILAISKTALKEDYNAIINPKILR